MSVITTGKTFANGEQLSADKLNLMLDNATFSNDAVDLTSTFVDSNGAIVVKDGGITTSKIADTAVTTAKIADSNVTKAKIEDVADMKVLGNTSGSATAPQEVSVLDEDDMVSDSDTSLASQQSIKAYADATAQSEAQAVAMQYSGSTGTIAATSSFSDLDLSSIVGSNRAFVVLAITGTANSNTFIRPNGSTLVPYFGASNAGYGASGTTVGATSPQGGIVITTTDASGIIEIKSDISNTISYTVLAYQVLQ